MEQVHRPDARMAGVGFTGALGVAQDVRPVKILVQQSPVGQILVQAA